VQLRLSRVRCVPDAPSSLFAGAAVDIAEIGRRGGSAGAQAHRIGWVALKGATALEQCEIEGAAKHTAREQWHAANPESLTLDPTSGTEAGRYILNSEPA